MPEVLITGGSGFLGRGMLSHSSFQNALVVGRTSPGSGFRFVESPIGPDVDFSLALNKIDVVVHAAARAHIINETSTDPLRDYRVINTFATLNLARQAVDAGVKRFIFISSSKVLGETTKLGDPFTHASSLNATGPYAVSKAEAEVGLARIAAESNMELVVIRPPLVYGNGVKGNFAKLLRLTASQIPLPFASVNNKRSLVALDNLVDLISVCLESKEAKDRTFLVSDGLDLSTPRLLRLVACSGGFKSQVFKCPQFFLKNLFWCAGKYATYEKLCDSMQLDISYTKQILNWSPPYSVEACLKKCW